MGLPHTGELRPGCAPGHSDAYLSRGRSLASVGEGERLQVSPHTWTSGVTWL
jgi:hypothetical protein